MSDTFLLNRFRKRIVAELEAVTQSSIVVRFNTEGITALTVNELALYERVYNPEMKRLFEKLQLWDTCNGKDWWFK